MKKTKSTFLIFHELPGNRLEEAITYLVNIGIKHISRTKFFWIFIADLTEHQETAIMLHFTAVGKGEYYDLPAYFIKT